MVMPPKGALLVVDDTEANLDLLVDMLGDDYDVMVAPDGEAALEAALECRPELILLDILMPGLDGYEVCRRLKANPRTERPEPLPNASSPPPSKDTAQAGRP